MWYALLHNNEIQVGPRTWSWSMFKDYLDEESLDSSQLPKRVNDIVFPIITESWSLVEVLEPTIPNHNRFFEQLAGPYWNKNESPMTGYYNVIEAPIHSIKGGLKEKITNDRWIVENIGTKITIQEKEFFIPTSRDERKVYVETLAMMNGPIIWKFGEGFLTISKEELETIVTAIHTHVQNAFNWEQTKHLEIDNCETVEQLKLIDLKNSLIPQPIIPNLNAS